MVRAHSPPPTKHGCLLHPPLFTRHAENERRTLTRTWASAGFSNTTVRRVTWSGPVSAVAPCPGAPTLAPPWPAVARSKEGSRIVGFLLRRPAVDDAWGSKWMRSTVHRCGCGCGKTNGIVLARAKALIEAGRRASLQHHASLHPRKRRNIP